jgi:hypothetical protein
VARYEFIEDDASGGGRLVFEDSATGDKLTLGGLNPLNPFLIGAYQ